MFVTFGDYRVIKVGIVVVDDEWIGIKASLERLGKAHELAFSGVSVFSVEAVVSEVERANPSILLLDIMHFGHERTGEDEAGIRLFKALANDSRWSKLRGSVQIVFFSNAATARREQAIAKEHRLDVGGYLDKNSLLNSDPEAIATLRGASEQASLYREYPELADSELRAACDLMFSPNSVAMRKVWEKILLASRNWEPVLISGETGTGKELVAKAIFDLAEKRAASGANPVRGSCGRVACNIGAMPREGNLQYVELFGARKGAASGMTDNRTGLFMRASRSGPQGGTVFLDEIGDTPPIIQVSLLRVLQENVITPLGGYDTESGQPQEEKVKFRLISASHVDLEQAVADHTFREDLYHRLRTIRIHVPPLRERKDDIGVLLYRFLDRLNDKKDGYGWDIHVDDEKSLIETLRSYDWPGNVRELEMAVRASYVSSVGNIFTLADEVLETIETARMRQLATSGGTLLDDELREPPIKTTGRNPVQTSSSETRTAATVAAKDTITTSRSVPLASSEAYVRLGDRMIDVRATPADLVAILEGLGPKDRKPDLSELEMLFGIPATMATYRLLAQRSGNKHLNDTTARQYFGSTQGTVTRWVNRAEKRLLALAASSETTSPDGLQRIAIRHDEK